MSNVGVQVFIWTYIFNSLGFVPRSGVARPYENSTFNSDKLPNGISQQLFHVTFPPAIYESSNFFTFLSTLVIFCLIIIINLIDVK